jgi:glycosyltransferase involved in cell wall biosynthesis
LKICISATNPCHLYDLAVALHARGELGGFFSGYPAWKLHPPDGFPLVARSTRTLITYGCLRLPAALRPPPHRLFRWQDQGFDRAVARSLEAAGGAFIHAMPGQALATFRRARELGMLAVLNHASGPVRQRLALIEGEYRRAGLNLSQYHGFDSAYFAREDAEYAAADYHCAASSIVRDQLLAAGVPLHRIWVVPYAADPEVFFPPPPDSPRAAMRVVFAGQLTQRKGLRVLFAAARALRQSNAVELHLYGPAMADIAPDLARIRDAPWITVHGAVGRDQLAAAFRAATVLVLPSWEEAFGLVVPQALNCGLPCIVSNRVGASELIRPAENGSIFPAGDSDALAREIAWWLGHRDRFSNSLLTWDEPARMVSGLSAKALEDGQ